MPAPEQKPPTADTPAMPEAGLASAADAAACLAELPDLYDELQRRLTRLDQSYRIGKPFVKLKFHDFTQTTLEQAGAGWDPDSYRLLLGQAFARGDKPVRLIGLGVRLVDLQGVQEQLRLF